MALLATTCSVAMALDVIHVFGEKPNDKISGTIGDAGISKDAVTIRGRTVKKVSVSKIRYILFDKDPTPIRNAKMTARNGGYSQALEQFNQSAVNSFEGFVKTDVEFYTLLCRAKLALAGQQPLELKEVAKDLNSFIGSSSGLRSYHYYESNQLLGDLLKAIGSKNAAKYYNRLASNPDYVMRANVAIGWLHFDQGNTTEAETAFDKVLADRSTDPEADRQRDLARLGKASCLAEGANPEQAIKMLEKVIAEADPSDWDLHARTYNVLGKLQNKANRKKAAILAYLHVDLLYAQDPDHHAEALGSLIKLFTEVSQPQNAAKTRTALKRLYPNSRWAK